MLTATNQKLHPSDKIMFLVFRYSFIDQKDLLNTKIIFKMGLLKSIAMKTNLGTSENNSLEKNMSQPNIAKKSIINFSPTKKIIMAKKTIMPPPHVWDKIEKILDQQNANKKTARDKKVITQLNFVKGEKQYSL